MKKILNKIKCNGLDVENMVKRDIKKILNGKIKPNRMANNAYKQGIVNYLLSHQEISKNMFDNFVDYIDSLYEIIVENERKRYELNF